MLIMESQAENSSTRPSYISILRMPNPSSPVRWRRSLIRARSGRQMTAPHIPASHDAFSVARIHFPLFLVAHILHFIFSPYVFFSVDGRLVLRLGKLRLLLTSFCKAAVVRVAEETMCWFFGRTLTI